MHDEILSQLFRELGTLKWMGEDAGWDLAITAVRKRILELMSPEQYSKEYDYAKED